jgi:hypothetical protein
MTRGSGCGEKVNDGDLRWNAVTPQDEERIAPGQNGLYCRKKMLSDLQFNDSIPEAFRAVRWRALPRFCQTGGSL